MCKWIKATILSYRVRLSCFTDCLVRRIFYDVINKCIRREKNISFDVPGAFLQAEMPDDKLVLLRFKGRLAEMLGEINDEYRKHIRRENGKTVLYVKVIRAIYGCIESALQWYKLFTTTLENMGFKINPYDKCVANKWVNGKQLSIAWHVDDCIASHIDESVLDDFARDMINEFGEMEITKGSCHVFCWV